MSQSMEPREPVKWFAEEMEKTLRANDGKGGWSRTSIYYLLNRARQELSELEQAVSKGAPVSEIIRESSDVANFMMMIADRARNRERVATGLQAES
jgi:hypothetical protein